jgi:hypothetical protein
VTGPAIRLDHDMKLLGNGAIGFDGDDQAARNRRSAVLTFPNTALMNDCSVSGY